MDIKTQIEQILQTSLAHMGIEEGKVLVSQSTDSSHGEYTTNVAMVIAKELGKNPLEVAEEIAQELRIKHPKGTSFSEAANQELRLLDKIEIVEPGFINFFVKKEVLAKAAVDLLEDKEASGKEKKKYVVEYSSPNIAKPFTVGHLRSTIIGDAVANLLEATGSIVYRDNHVGDWGTQFGKQIVAIKKWGNEEAISKSLNPVKELVGLYVKFHEEAEKDPTLENEARLWFKKLEDGDSEARELWKKCIEWSWKEFDQIYKELGVSFTENNGRGFGEAYFEDKMQPAIAALEEKNLLKEGEEGAQLVFFPNDILPPMMVLKKDGATLYATRDLATDYFRLHRYGKDIIIINEVGTEQSLYLKQIYKTEEILGWFKPEQRIHIKHGHYRFKEGKMATRKGNVIWLENVLEEAKHRAFNIMTRTHNIEWGEDYVETKSKDNTPTAKFSTMPTISDQVAIGALKWNDLKRSPEQDILFNWDDILNMQGNSGPYLQYTYVRTQSVLRKWTIESGQLKIETIGKGINFQTYTFSREESELLRTISFFEETISQAATQFAPHILATYLFTLAQQFNLFYQKQPILKAEKIEQEMRLFLVLVTAKVLKEGLKILGIAAPERM